jgi:CheY-like chemotaxis protein
MTLRCVIVDDNPDVLRAASDLLAGQGIAVVGVAATSGEAVPLVEERAPDVILVDIALGQESGIELTRRLGQSRSGAGPDVILISTHDEADYGDLIAASPAIGFLPKTELSATAIRRLLARANARRGKR